MPRRPTNKHSLSEKLMRAGLVGESIADKARELGTTPASGYSLRWKRNNPEKNNAAAKKWRAEQKKKKLKAIADAEAKLAAKSKPTTKT